MRERNNKNKAGYTTNRCGYCWARAAKVAARLFQGSHNTLHFKLQNKTMARTDGQTLLRDVTEMRSRIYKPTCVAI